jgi:hypothetical protein
MLFFSVCRRDFWETTAPEELGNISEDGGDVFVASIDVVYFIEHSNRDRSRMRGDLRYRSSIFVSPKDVTDWTKNVLRERLSGKFIRLELGTPLECRDHHAGRVLHV